MNCEPQLLKEARAHIGLSRRDFVAGRINAGYIKPLIIFLLERLFVLLDYSKHLASKYARLLLPINIRQPIGNLLRRGPNNFCAEYKTLADLFDDFSTHPKIADHVGVFQLDAFLYHHSEICYDWFDEKFAQAVEPIDTRYIVVVDPTYTTLLTKNGTTGNSLCIIDSEEEYNYFTNYDHKYYTIVHTTTYFNPEHITYVDMLLDVLLEQPTLYDRDYKIFIQFMNDLHLSQTEKIKYVIRATFLPDIASIITEYVDDEQQKNIFLLSINH